MVYALSKAGHYRRLIDKSTTNLSIDNVGYRLSMNSAMQHCRYVVVEFKFMTDYVELSMKIVQWHCQSVVVELKFVIDKVELSMRKSGSVVGL